MVRVILFLLAIAALATGLSWLADRPGDLVLNWEGYEVQTTVFRAVVIFSAILALSVFVFSISRQIWQSPAAVGHYLSRRRQKRGLDALSSGMIAIGAGDRSTATRYAIQARRSLPNEPLTHLLRAQAAQLSGDKATARRIFEAMLGSPDTEQLGLRGLFLEAEHEGETEAARQFAERAVRLNPKLSWPVDALFDLQCKQRDWRAALDTLAVARKNGHVDKKFSDRRRAVLLTAQAQAAEDGDPEKALSLAMEANNLAADLVPAAAIAARLLASRGNTPRATKIIQKTWSRSPHPDLAHAYAYSRIGDSPRDRLDRVRQLASLTPNSIESPIAIATTAIEAKDFETARKALEPLNDGRLTHRICLSWPELRASSTAIRVASASGSLAPSTRRAIPPGPPMASHPTIGSRSRRSPASLMRSSGAYLSSRWKRAKASCSPASSTNLSRSVPPMSPRQRRKSSTRASSTRHLHRSFQSQLSLT